MICRLYHFSKRNRSTAVPPASLEYTEVNLALKEETTITQPVFKIQTEVGYVYNYLYCTTFNRYYFITEVRSVEGMWELVCAEDYLASFKAAIGSTSAMIKYATGSTKNIVDDRIPVLADVTINESVQAFTDIDAVTEGDIVLGLTGKGSFGPYFLDSPLQLPNMLDGIDDWWTNLSPGSVWDATQQLIYGGSASECFKSAIMIPFKIPKTGPSEDLYLGNYPCKDSSNNNITGHKITQYVYTAHEQISIPWEYNDWRRNQSYTDVLLYIPFVGVLNIPVAEVRDANYLNIDFALNVTSGDIAVNVHVVHGIGGRRTVATGSGNCAMSCPYGSTGIDTGKLTQGYTMAAGAAVSAAVAAATGGVSLMAELAMFGTMAAATGTTISALGGSGSGSGGLGGGASSGLDLNMRCYVVQKKFTETQSNVDPIMGKPYMGISTPGSFSGYVQTDGFQLSDPDSYQSERETINKMLDTGIYYE